MLGINPDVALDGGVVVVPGVGGGEGAGEPVRYPTKLTLWPVWRVAGGTPFEIGLNFRVAHPSRRS